MTTDERKQIVQELLREGRTLSEILDHLHKEKQDTITYFELRLLLSEMPDVTLPEKAPPPPPAEPEPVAAAMPPPEAVPVAEPVMISAPPAEPEVVVAEEVPAPVAVPKPRRARRPKRTQPTWVGKVYRKLWRDRGWVGKAITLSLLLHAGLLVISGFIIIMRAQLKTPIQFIAEPPSRPSLQPHKLDMKVKVQDLQKASARPRLQPRMLASRMAAITLPEIQKAPNTADMKIRQDYSSIGTTGIGLGIGGGFGTGIGGGRGGGLPLIMSGRCSPAERATRLMANAGDPRCDMAVYKGLKWLAGQQNGDGSWGRHFPTAMTGLALLAYLGHCETPDAGPFAVNVSKGLRYLIRVGNERDGRLYLHNRGQSSYEHAIATYALAEAYTICKEPEIPSILRKSVEVIVRGQTGNGGWVYGYGGSGIDMSVTGWNVQALKAAQYTGLSFNAIPVCLQRASNGVKSMMHPSGDWRYQANQPHPRPTLTGVGVYCLQLAGQGMAPEVRNGFSAIEKRGYSYNGGGHSLYECYYKTMASFQRGGIPWRKWNDIFMKQLLSKQNGDGSWQADADALAGAVEGDIHIYRACLAILTLEVYYRYLPSYH